MIDTRKKPRDHREQTSRSWEAAETAVCDWYDRRESAKLTKVKRRGAENTRVVPDVPDEYIRSCLFIGQSNRTDGITAYGAPSNGYRESSPPIGRGSQLDIVSRAEAAAMRRHAEIRAETRAITDFSMQRVRLLNPIVWVITEMWAAGWRPKHIAEKMRESDEPMSEHLAARYLAIGVGQVQFALLTKPSRSAGMIFRQPRHMLTADLYPAKM